MKKQPHAGGTALVTDDQSLEQTTQVLGEKQPRPKQRAKGPTYEAGFPACTQGAAGGMMTGLRVGGKGQRSNLKLRK